MKSAIKKSDFVLAPYMKSNNLKASCQILNTVIPYTFLWFLGFKAAATNNGVDDTFLRTLFLFDARLRTLFSF
jgi:omega-6 fatty acid desaturase (delta-12 desaturase)